MPESDPAALLAADREFARVTSEHRLEGWMSYFDEASARVPISGDIVQGLAAVRASDASLFADPALQFTWEPEVGAFIEPGQLGFTRGRYRLFQLGDDGAETVVSTGVYLTVWRHTAAGWRVALDTGVPDA